MLPSGSNELEASKSKTAGAVGSVLVIIRSMTGAAESVTITVWVWRPIPCSSSRTVSTTWYSPGVWKRISTFSPESLRPSLTSQRWVMIFAPSGSEEADPSKLIVAGACEPGGLNVKLALGIWLLAIVIYSRITVSAPRLSVRVREIVNWPAVK